MHENASDIDNACPIILQSSEYTEIFPNPIVVAVTWGTKYDHDCASCMHAKS